MKSRVRIGTVILAVAGLSCANATGIELSDLAGTWTAQSLVFTDASNASVTFDIIANGGSFAMTLTAEGDYTSSFNFEQESETATGTFAVTGTTFTLAESGQGSPEDFQITRDGNNMTLVGTDTWDFNDNGTEDDATLTVVLTR